MPRSKKRTRSAAESDEESDDAQDVTPAVRQRSRRSTAGKRMSTLVGQAQEDDETFWSHPVWSEGATSGREAANERNLKKRRRDNGDSSCSSSNGDDDNDSLSDGEASYRISDEDSEAAVDQFDSDFDETESEDENDNDIGGEKMGSGSLGKEERELRAEERREANAKRKKNQKFGAYSGMKKSIADQAAHASAGRQLMKRKEGNRSKRGTVTKRGVMGTGWNEGLVLNWPAHEVTSASTLKQPANVALVVNSSHPTIAKPIEFEKGAMKPTIDSCNSTASISSVTDHNTLSPIDSTKTVKSQQSLQPVSTHSNGAIFQTAPSSLQLQDATTPPPPLHSKLPTIGTKTMPPIRSHPLQLSHQHQQNLQRSPPTRKRSLRAGTLSKTKATANSVAQSTKLTQIRQAANHEKKKLQPSKNKRHFTQEEMILEAIQKTEIENAKWIFARKRRKEEVALMDNHTTGGSKKGKTASGSSNDGLVTPVSRFYSRKGCHNILTFMDMDHLPEIFTRRNTSHINAGIRSRQHLGSDNGNTRQSLNHSQPLSTELNEKKNGKTPHQSGKPNITCIITGKVAKYRDPKTQLGYHDLNAFRELRRRLEAGELTGFETWSEDSQKSQKKNILLTQPSTDNHKIQPRNGNENWRDSLSIQNSESSIFEPTPERQHHTAQQIIEDGSTNGVHDTSPLKRMKTEKDDNSTMKQGYATLN